MQKVQKNLSLPLPGSVKDNSRKFRSHEDNLG